MVSVLTLAKNDFKNIVRDRFLIYATIVFPLMIIMISRIIKHWIADSYPAIEGAFPLLFLLFLLTIPFIFAFISAFLIIDERDEHLLTILRVMPISRNTYLIYRMLFVSLLAFVFILIFPNASGLIDNTQFSFINYIPSAVLLAFLTPFATLLVATFATNKVQAFAIFKLGGTVFFLPLVAFFTDSIVRWVFGLVPNFWAFMALDTLMLKGTIDWTYLVVGFIYQIALIIVLFYIFNRKN